jgi:hypothetical protein
MPDNSKKFHEFALKSILFKGRSDWYFCYLKTEKIAHVLAILAGGEARELEEIAHRAAELPQNIAYLAAGEMDAGALLADIFGLLAELRIGSTQGELHKDTAALLCKEYEEVAQRLVAGSHPSPFVTTEDFRVSALPELEGPLPHSQFHLKDIKDTSRMSDKTQSERMSLILSFIQKNKRASIKDIAAVIKGCSEKTIQRELGALIEQGLVRKIGERRWSVYVPA